MLGGLIVQGFLDVTAILGVVVASLQVSLLLGWGLLSLILNSMQQAGARSKK